MKFNDKLIELRKKKGLSQEELGYELNVTRQTISKWELGQTKPEMEKLIEISKYFNISVDELLDEENNNQEKIKKQKVGFNWKPIIIIGIILLAIILFCIVSFIATIITIGKTTYDTATSIMNTAASTINDINSDLDVEFNVNEAKETFDEISNVFNEDFDTEVDEMDNEFEKESFNTTYTTLYQGIQNGFHVKNAINRVINDNLENERKIEVEYKETITKEQEEIINIRKNFEDFTEYMVSYEYDEEGYICKMIIKDI
ncbi:MAG: helix-turn-helix domain-containing protein [Clostridia bacterium]|nr:helix-turn-helix domain-containing protein [Clostridia bacterium]